MPSKDGQEKIVFALVYDLLSSWHWRYLELTLAQALPSYSHLKYFLRDIL